MLRRLRPALYALCCYGGYVCGSVLCWIAAAALLTCRLYMRWRLRMCVGFFSMRRTACAFLR